MFEIEEKLCETQIALADRQQALVVASCKLAEKEAALAEAHCRLAAKDSEICDLRVRMAGRLSIQGIGSTHVGGHIEPKPPTKPPSIWKKLLKADDLLARMVRWACWSYPAIDAARSLFRRPHNA